ncbi:TIGR03086 family metal-binding protein [Streptomyces sp. CB03911]|uniref:TIGR03086 family metal-binding protein n=1 Tax=Streptomyces sp. CB03911 TaxID=1804758 RepID=UPI00093F33CD|nr:TIGR03086 family metal-binding protein [Streptomyces sp. CB03911]OKI16465.1 TIGR03086 family protein [Streptomyces sp. CB03911]
MSALRWTVLDEAHQALRSAVAGVPADGWQRPTPAGRWTVAQVLQHAAADQLAYAARLTGGPGPDYDPFEPSGTILGSPAELLETALTASAEAFAAVDPADAQVPVPLPPYTLTAARAVAAAALDAAVHAWDIAVATGRPSPLTPALAKALRPVADDVVEPLRGYAFASALEPAADADEADALLNHLGRRADWGR